MNKSELIDAIASHTDQSKASVAAFLDGFTSTVASALKQGDSVNLIGFGSFTVKERSARTGRNPQTGAAMDIAASRTPAFKAGKAFKDAI